jgi:YidC/Oxa1 family membrane protein insertase
MDRNTIIGFVLIFLVLLGFSYLNQPSKEQIAQRQAEQRTRDSLALVAAQQIAEQQAREAATPTVAADNSDSIADIRLTETFGSFAPSAAGEETFATLDNDVFTIRLSSRGARVASVELKGFRDFRGRPLYIFDETESAFAATLVTGNNRVVSTGDLYFETVESTPLGAVFRLKTDQPDAWLDFVYSIHQDDYIVDFNIVPHNLHQVVATAAGALDIAWRQKIRQQEKGRDFETRYSQLYYKYLSDDVDYLKESKDDARQVANRMKWIGFKDQYFSSVLIAKESFGSGLLESKYFATDTTYLKECAASTSVAFDAQNPVGFNFFFGPNDYALLRNYDKNFFAGQDLQLERLVPLGWSLFRYVSKWIIIPIFNWLTNTGMGLGLAIFLLTFIIRTLMVPLTYKSYLSSAKMRVLKPQIAELTAKLQGQENAVARQQKTMELYRQVGINPMAGCLPMLIQMPVWLALFWLFPTCIQLRGQSFLWANDLSTYDDLIHFGFSIPFLGSHLSIFCLLMTVTQVFYTKYSMAQTDTGQEQMPGMKWMMYLMPVFMLFFLNSYPAGLNYYYFVSALISIAQTIGIRYTINETKLLAQLEENKKKVKPKKKSGFMARLEEAQRRQQQLLKEQQKRKR